GEARAWVEQLLPTTDALDPQARTELLWTAAVAAREVGDDAAAQAARQRLAALLAGIDDPYLHALSQLAMAWTYAIDGASTTPCGRLRSAWRSSGARRSPSGRLRPWSPSAPWRRPSAATTTPCAT